MAVIDGELLNAACKCDPSHVYVFTPEWSAESWGLQLVDRK